MLTLTVNRVRSGPLIYPDGPFDVPRPGDEQGVRRVLLPFPWPSGSETPADYQPRAAYVYERTREVTEFEINGNELVQVTRDQFTREIVSLFIPEDHGLLLMAGSELQSRMASHSLLDLAVQSGAAVTIDAIDFDLQAIDAAFANDQWKRGFDMTGGYIEHGTVYGERIEADPLLTEIRTQSLPNEVGVTVNVTAARMKVRVLRNGRIQFPGVRLSHLEHGDHPNLGDPWPAIFETLDILDPHMRIA